MDLPLSDLLQSWQPAAPEPDDFRRDVWAKIETGERVPRGWALSWLAALAQPRVAAGLIACALLAGALGGQWLVRESRADTYLRSVNPYAMGR